MLYGKHKYPQGAGALKQSENTQTCEVLNEGLLAIGGNLLLPLSLMYYTG